MKGRVLFTTILVLSLWCLSLHVPPASAELSRYTVEPVNSGMETGTPLDTVPVSFWNLPPQIMALSLAISLSPIIAFPAELLVYTKLYLYFGYRKIARHNIFDNKVRNRIHACIRENPGIQFMAISRETDIVPGTLQHHLTLLRLARKVTLLETHGHTRYFENSGKYPEIEKKILKYLQKPTERSIFDLIIRNPDMSRKELGQHLGLSGASVTWHMYRLSDDRLITIDKVGKNSRYVIDPEAAQYLQKYLIDTYEENHAG